MPVIWLDENTLEVVNEYKYLESMVSIVLAKMNPRNKMAITSSKVCIPKK